MKRFRNRFHQYLKSLPTVSEEHSYLLAVSGGPDSMAMAVLFRSWGMKIGVAHCNFQLRGAESDTDEQFVEQWALGHAIPFFKTRFPTRQYADEQSLSIQMAARHLRYVWFEHIRVQNGFDWICTAHHLDDQAETMLIQWMRGTGISGFRGMKPVNGKILRPMMFARQHEIINFLRETGQNWRDDSSNQHDDYLRNYLRHTVFPLLDQSGRGWIQNVVSTGRRLEWVERIFEKYLQEESNRRIRETDKEIRIITEGFSRDPDASLLLYEWLKKWGYRLSQAEEIARHSGGRPGKVFFSPTHRAIIERDYLSVSAISDRTVSSVYTLPEAETTLEEPLRLSLRIVEGGIRDMQDCSRYVAWFDADQISFPLQLRKAAAGDRIRPLGMKGRQKVSDVLIRNKLSTLQKESVWLLCSPQEVLWIVGIRQSDYGALTSSTSRVLRVEWEQ